MSGVGKSWYATNTTRAYPLAGYATATDDSGVLFPESIIADAKLRFEGDPSDVPYISFVESGDHVSVVISVGDKDIAVATTTRQVEMGSSPVPLYPLDRKVEGWVTLGSAPALGTWKFSDHSQSALARRAARPFTPAATTGRLTRAGFVASDQPNVYLSGQGDVTVTKGKRVLNGVERDAVIVGLRDDLPAETVAAYSGLCGRRPESSTCGDPEPIQSINGVQADCCGRIFIEVRGCADLIPLREKCGVVMSCPVSTDDICPPKHLPDENGILPSDQTANDDCEVEEDPIPETEQQFED